MTKRYHAGNLASAGYEVRAGTMFEYQQGADDELLPSLMSEPLHLLSVDDKEVLALAFEELSMMVEPVEELCEDLEELRVPVLALEELWVSIDSM